MKHMRKIFWSPLLVALSLVAGAAQAAVRYHVVTIGRVNTDGHSINNAGQIVGSANNGNDNWHAFRYTAGVMQDLGTLGGSVSGASDINRHGQVVGSAGVNDQFRWSHAFLYDGAGMRDLGTFGGNYSG